MQKSASIEALFLFYKFLIHIILITDKKSFRILLDITGKGE